MQISLTSMAKKIQIKPGDTVTLKLTEEQADLIVDLTLLDDDLLAIIHHSKLRDGVVSVRCTLDDLEVLSGYIAAESNNTKDKKLQRRLDAISDAIDELNLTYSTDTSTAPPMVKRHLSLVKK
jgi:hypothetical protein